MSHVLIVYATTDGQTQKVSECLRQAVLSMGCKARVIEAKDALSDVVPFVGHAVLIAASVHAGGFQKSIKRWVKTNAASLNGMPTAFFPVCLGILENRPEAQAEVKKIVQDFLTESGWTPTEVHPTAGAVLFTRYNLIKRLIMKRIVAKADGETDTHRDYEYTNWKELGRQTREFIQKYSLTPDSKALLRWPSVLPNFQSVKNGSSS